MALRNTPTRASQTEAEKPVWISLADLMTALVVLFVVIMAVAIHQVKQGTEGPTRTRNDQIDACIQEVRAATQETPGVTIQDYTIDFGSRARFALNRYDLTSEQVSVLRGFVPQVLAIAEHKGCKTWLKRVVVDGFASHEGTYLYNLDLSMERSERVLCVLLDPNGPGHLDDAERKAVEKLFFVGGSSYNSLKSNMADSRRIELKLEFYALHEPQPSDPRTLTLDQDSTCPIDRR